MMFLTAFNSGVLIGIGLICALRLLRISEAAEKIVRECERRTREECQKCAEVPAKEHEDAFKGKTVIG